jgi:hypothetical protein
MNMDDQLAHCGLSTSSGNRHRHSGDTFVTTAPNTLRATPGGSAYLGHEHLQRLLTIMIYIGENRKEKCYRLQSDTGCVLSRIRNQKKDNEGDNDKTNEVTLVLLFGKTDPNHWKVFP